MHSDLQQYWLRFEHLQQCIRVILYWMLVLTEGSEPVCEWLPALIVVTLFELVALAIRPCSAQVPDIAQSDCLYSIIVETAIVLYGLLHLDYYEQMVVRGKPATGSVTQLGPNWVHVQVREIDNIVVNQDISYCNKTLFGI